MVLVCGIFCGIFCGNYMVFMWYFFMAFFLFLVVLVCGTFCGIFWILVCHGESNGIRARHVASSERVNEKKGIHGHIGKRRYF